MEGTGSDHFTLSVEIEQATLNPAHPNNVKEVQALAFSTADTREMTRLTIVNPDKGTFRITFMNPKTFKKEVSEEMKANMSAAQISNSVKKYFNGAAGANPVVTKTNYDADNKVTEDAEKVVKSVYEIKLDRLINGQSAESMTLNKLSSKSEITLEPLVVKSGPPISGKYKIKCVYEDGAFSETKPMAWNTNHFNIFRGIGEGCMKMRDRIRIFNKAQFPSQTVGTAFYIDFNGYNGNVGQFEIVSDPDDPLVGVDLTYEH